MSALSSLRSGAWVTAGRLRMIGTLLATAYGAVAVFLLTGAGIFDRLGRPIGSDFAAFYGASHMFMRGFPAAAPYDPDVYNREIAAFTGPFHYVWMDPPTALAL